MKKYFTKILIVSYILFFGWITYWAVGELQQPSEEQQLIESCEDLNGQINQLTPEQLYYFLSQGDNALEMDYIIHKCKDAGVEIKYEVD